MKHPMQHQYIDHQNVTRFTENKLVSWLIDQLPDKQNALSIEHQTNSYDDADYDQILQMCGYSVSGIPYRNRDLYAITDGDKKPEEAYEESYKKLKSCLAPIMSEMFDIDVVNQ